MTLSENQKRFFAEIIGTFVLVVFATGSVVTNAQSGGKIGLWYEGFAPFVALSILVPIFGRFSMAHFNPAVTLAFLMTKHISVKLLPTYFTAQFIGAFLASVFVKFTIGSDANLGSNLPNYNFGIPEIFGIEILTTAILIAVILVVVHTKKFKIFGGMAIGGAVFFDIFFLSFISGASMNPIRSLAPAVLSGFTNDLWLYWSAPFAAAIILAAIYRKFCK